MRVVKEFQVFGAGVVTPMMPTETCESAIMGFIPERKAVTRPTGAPIDAAEYLTKKGYKTVRNQNGTYTKAFDLPQLKLDQIR